MSFQQAKKAKLSSLMKKSLKCITGLVHLMRVNAVCICRDSARVG